MPGFKFITSNSHKVKEAQKLANTLDVGINIIQCQKVKKIEIQAESLKKVIKYAANQIKIQEYTNFFLEDSGLFIQDLQGFPGVYSHFILEKLGNKGVLKLMENVKNRKAHFKSVVALCTNANIKIFQGTTRGRISQNMRGAQGFGFDPIFIPSHSTHTFGEMSREKKNQYSHRGKSMRKLINSLVSQGT